jgi:hypothetical protein
LVKSGPDANIRISRPLAGPADSTKKADVAENPKVSGHVGFTLQQASRLTRAAI